LVLFLGRVTEFNISDLNYHNELMSLRSLLDGIDDYVNLDSTQLASLETYANATNGIQYHVYPILAMNDALDYVAPIYHPYNSSNYNAMTIPNDNKKEENQTAIDNSENNIRLLADSKSHLLIYPNPARDEIKIEYKIENEIGNATLKIFNLEGKLVYSVILQSPTGVQKINVENFRNGHYICILEANETELQHMKFSIKR